MGTSATIMRTSECCRQQSASSDANILHPPAQFPPCGNGFPLRPVAALSHTNCHLELSTSKSGPFCRHIAYLSARRSNGVPERMPRALNKTVKGTKSAKTVKAKTARRVIKPWTKEDVRTLKAHSKARTPVTRV